MPAPQAASTTRLSLVRWLYATAVGHLGDRHRSAAAWAWLLTGLALWAPQDLALSIHARVWTHVWVDSLALLVLLPPLVWLWRHDSMLTSRA